MTDELAKKIIAEASPEMRALARRVVTATGRKFSDGDLEALLVAVLWKWEQEKPNID